MQTLTSGKGRAVALWSTRRSYRSVRRRPSYWYGGSSLHSSAAVGHFRPFEEHGEASSTTPLAKTPSLSTIHRLQRRYLGWDGGPRGHDLTMEALQFGGPGGQPKIILDGYSNAGFSVYNVIKKVDQDVQQEEQELDGGVHLYGSVMAFPLGCFLWNVSRPEDVTLESLLPVLLHRPQVEMLFIGVADQQALDRAEMDRVRNYFLKEHNMVVETQQLGNAMGTFNILNAEDRPVAVALVVEEHAEDDDENE